MANTLQNLIRVGVVSSRNPEKCAVKVIISDQDNMVSNWLPVIVPQSLKNKDYALPDVGEQVVCLFLGNGIETGYCLGSIYSEADVPPTNNGNKRGTWFEDGSYVEWDRGTGDLTIRAKGNINIIADGDITITSEGNITTSAGGANTDISFTKTSPITHHP